MKRIIAMMLCVIMLASMCICAQAAGIELPDVQVGGNNNNNEQDTPTGGGIELPDVPTNPGNNPEEEPKEEVTPMLTPFEKLADVSITAWYYDEIKYVVENGLFAGVSETSFAPKKAMTRAEFVQVLANLEKVDVSDKNVETKFSDVKPGQWFAPAVKWASEKGIVEGMGNGTFLPNAPISREQMCVMLVNYIAYNGVQIIKVEDKAEFADNAKISDWAADRVYACQMADIINGKDAGLFDPQNTAIRAEVATMFSRFHAEYKDKI